MILRVRDAFREKMRGNACQEAISYQEFYIQDPPAPSDAPCYSYPAPARSRFDLQVINSNSQLVHLIQVDKCIYASGDASRCDCVLLTEAQAYFIEFKMTDTDITSAGNERYARASDCMGQLETTIKEFFTRGVIAPGSLVIAYACVGRTTQRPYPGADYLKLSAAFNERFAGIPLRTRLIVNNTLNI